jgi:hypothetical protein
MLEKESGRRVTVMEPLLRNAFGKVAAVVFNLSEDSVRDALTTMARDPTESFIHEGVGVRAWDRYEAGGPLEAEDVDLNVSPELADMVRPQLIAVLDGYHQGPDVIFIATSDPWKVFVRAPEAPTATVYVFPGAADPLDLTVRILLGKRDRTTDALPRAGIALAWDKVTVDAMDQWVKSNQQRALSDHPAFESIVQSLQPGLPGLFVIRTPPVPFSPLLPVGTYQHRVAAAVFETHGEYEQCERFYREPGAAFFETPPIFRNRPPFSYTPASLAGGIEEGRAYILETEWPDIGAVSVYAIPGDILTVRPDLKAGAFRERYGVQFHKDIAAAAEFWRRFPGQPPIEVGRVQHPRRGGSGV